MTIRLVDAAPKVGGKVVNPQAGVTTAVGVTLGVKVGVSVGVKMAAGAFGTPNLLLQAEESNRRLRTISIKKPVFFTRKLPFWFSENHLTMRDLPLGPDCGRPFIIMQ